MLLFIFSSGNISDLSNMKISMKGILSIIYLQLFEVRSMKDPEDNLGGCGTQGHLLSYNKKEKMLTRKASHQENSCLIQNFAYS